MIQNKHKFAFLLCMLLMTTTVFGASEAEYKKLAKTWTLNADGSQEFRYDMELTLFTHTAMNGTYGESFIVYNPQYQELKINSSYTKQKTAQSSRHRTMLSWKSFPATQLMLRLTTT